MFRKLHQFVSRHFAEGYGYPIVSILVALLTLCLNFRSQLMSGLLPYYFAQADIFRSGFDFAGAKAPTFPMWGYGWLLMVTQQRVLIFSLQLAIAIICGGLFLRVFLKKTNVLPWALLVLSLCIPWYALQTTLTPYGLAGSLVCLALALLILGTESTKGWAYIVSAGLVFGIALNLRSDFYLMPVGLAAIVVYSFRSWRVLGQLAAWAVVIGVTMIPWMIYSNAVSGKPLLTSTNGGHSLFIGLGQYPDNVWGITPSDNDPLMHEILSNEVGDGVHSCSHEADDILKQEFKTRVRENPNEYANKALLSLFNAITSGAYPGEFLSKGEWMPSSEVAGHFKRAATAPASYAQDHGLLGLASLFLLGVSYAMSMGLVALSSLLVPLNGIVGLLRRDRRAMLIVAVISYNLLIQAFVFQMFTYSGMLMVFHIANIAISLGFIFNLRTKVVARKNGARANNDPNGTALTDAPSPNSNP